MSQSANLTWFEALPKVELHLHLEGAIPYDALWELVRKYSGETLMFTKETLKDQFKYIDFPHFIETWVWKNQFINEYEDFTFFSEAVAHDLASQNIRYAEVFFSPPDFVRKGLKAQQITESIRQGLDRVKEIEIALVADLVRDFGPEKAEVTLAEIDEVKDLDVIGVGIGGSEQDFPPEAFESVFEKARQLGFQTSAHAGEAAGAESVWGAVRRLRVDRIGHGTRAEEDESLLDYLVKQKIPVEICPISNVRTGVVKSYESHPVRRYFERGMLLSINTDDPKMFGNSLAEEYLLLTEKQGFTRAEVKELILSGIRTSWMPKEKKQTMIDAFCSDPAWAG